MRHVFLALLGLTLSLGQASAQLTVHLRPAKELYLVYESIPITVTLRNYSGRTIELATNSAEPWLTFMVTDESNVLLPAYGQLKMGDAPVLIPPGQSVSHTIDLLPLYGMRERGNYRVRANVAANGVSASSAPASFSLINGRPVWSQTVGLPGEEPGIEQYRRYELLGRRDMKEDSLYVLVREEPSGLTYSLVPLGTCLPNGQPQTVLDRHAQLHVLYQNAPRSFGYVSVGTDSRVLARRAYSDFNSRPLLVLQNGEVVVRGGEQTYPRSERILTDDELNPPPPPAPPKPKKKWWQLGRT